MSTTLGRVLDVSVVGCLLVETHIADTWQWHARCRRNFQISGVPPYETDITVLTLGTSRLIAKKSRVGTGTVPLILFLCLGSSAHKLVSLEIFKEYRYIFNGLSSHTGI
jgi:hypothetical protein